MGKARKPQCKKQVRNMKKGQIRVEQEKLEAERKVKLEAMEEEESCFACATDGSERPEFYFDDEMATFIHYDMSNKPVIKLDKNSIAELVPLDGSDGCGKFTNFNNNNLLFFS